MGPYEGKPDADRAALHCKIGCIGAGNPNEFGRLRRRRRRTLVLCPGIAYIAPTQWCHVK